MTEPALAAVDFHLLTRHAPGRLGVRDDPRMLAFRPMRPDRRPPQFKVYPGQPREPVPPALERLLFLTAGVTRVAEHATQGRLFFRAAGSAGNLSPLEVYVVENGRVLHYEPVEHEVTPVGRASEGPTTIVVSGVPWRTGWKYGERGYRHLYWDAGTMLSHLLAVAGARARLVLGFVDAEVSRLLGADGTHEFPLAAIVLGDGDPPLDSRPGEASVTGFLAEQPLEFPVITAAQRAGDLASAEAVAAWRVAAPSSPAPADVTFGRPLGDVVRQRGSSRAFDPSGAVAGQEFLDAMTAATAPLNGDFTARGATLLDHHLLAHGVEGTASGAYRWHGGHLEAAGEGIDTRALGRFLCLGQDLGGSGAYTVFHGSDLEAVFACLGDRGYRAAQLEAGVVEGRLHLAAYAQGFGATGLTFFDDEVRKAFSTTSWPMLVTAVGRPPYRSKAGGEPGRPTVLTGL